MIVPAIWFHDSTRNISWWYPQYGFIPAIWFHDSTRNMVSW